MVLRHQNIAQKYHDYNKIKKLRITHKKNCFEKFTNTAISLAIEKRMVWKFFVPFYYS